MPKGREALATRLSRGDPAAFEDLWDRHADGLYHYLLGRTRCVETAEDLLQAVMLRLVRSRARLAGVASLRAYLYAMARNEFRRHLSRHGPVGGTGETAVDLIEAPRDGPEFEDLDALRVAIADLSPERLEVISLKVWEGLTFAAIGETLGISPNTAASRYRYALRDLRLRMETSHER